MNIIYIQPVPVDYGDGHLITGVDVFGVKVGKFACVGYPTRCKVIFVDVLMKQVESEADAFREICKFISINKLDVPYTDVTTNDTVKTVCVYNAGCDTSNETWGMRNINVSFKICEDTPVLSLYPADSQLTAYLNSSTKEVGGG